MKKIIIPATIIILLLIFFLPGLLIKVRVNCRSQYGECPFGVSDKLVGINGKRLVMARRELEKTLSTNFLVSAYTIQFKLPNILKVDLIIKKPIFALKNATSGTFALVDKEGMVLATSSQASLPVVIINEDLPTVGSRVSEKNLFALDLIHGVYKMYQTGSGNIEGDTLLVDLPGSIRVIFPLAGIDADTLLGSLRLIYKNIRENEGGTLYSQIDLRYKNPVLR